MGFYILCFVLKTQSRGDLWISKRGGSGMSTMCNRCCNPLHSTLADHDVIRPDIAHNSVPERAKGERFTLRNRSNSGHWTTLGNRAASGTGATKHLLVKDKPSGAKPSDENSSRLHCYLEINRCFLAANKQLIARSEIFPSLNDAARTVVCVLDDRVRLSLARRWIDRRCAGGR